MVRHFTFTLMLPCLLQVNSVVSVWGLDNQLPTGAGSYKSTVSRMQHAAIPLHIIQYAPLYRICSVDGMTSLVVKSKCTIQALIRAGVLSATSPPSLARPLHMRACMPLV